MKARRVLTSGLLVLLGLIGCDFASPQSLQQQNEVLLRQLQHVHGLSGDQINAIRKIFAKSGYIGQGNPAITQHPVTPGACQAKLNSMGVQYENPRFERICKAKYMAPLYDPAKKKPEDAKACIDQFEFPDIPCTYPVVWVKAREAAQICSAMGKRLCDAHEWEGACAGDLEAPDYRFDLAKGVSPEEAIRRMRFAHNQAYSTTKSWSYGPTYQKGICATGSKKKSRLQRRKAGQNAAPTPIRREIFPRVAVRWTLYDLNGNAAEHMNLPLNESQMASSAAPS